MSTNELAPLRPSENGAQQGTPSALAPVSLPAPPARALLQPRSIEEAMALADGFARSGMFAVKSKEQALVVLVTGLELGFGPAQAMRGIHVIQGRPTLSADMMAAVCKSRPDVCRYFNLEDSTDQIAVYVTHRVGEPAPVRMPFTIEDAKRADLLKNDTWRKFPAAMLRARAAAALARAVYSDLILGLYTPDEAAEIPPPVPDAVPRPLAPPAGETRADAAWKAARRAASAAIKALDSEGKAFWSEEIGQRFGTADLNEMSRKDLEEVALLIAEAQGQIAAAAEGDPFADEDDEQPALLGVAPTPERRAGHGDS